MLIEACAASGYDRERPEAIVSVANLW